ncbi:MAG: hypothetical protein ABI859_03955 [Pseudomonadota bacterium]
MKRLSLLVALLLLVFGCSVAQAEPYLAMRAGLKCSACHENPTGGGLRTTLGNVWAQNMLAQRPLVIGDAPWTGSIGRYLSLGADLRANATYTDVPRAKTADEFKLDELRVYLQLNAIPDRLQLYIDQRVAPGNSTNMEAYGKLWFGSHRWYLKGGRMYLPYGLRLEDDSAYIRQVPGINFTTPDNGAEIGFEGASWTAQLAVSNGTAGGPELDQGKQWSLKAEHVLPRWRVGASFNFNDSDAGDRRMQNVYAGLRTGPVAWLAEIDYIVDEGFFGGARHQVLGLVEANWNLRAGQNLKLSLEGFDPDTDVSEDEQNRVSLVWEYAPLPYVQLRIGARIYDGIPQNDLQNRKTAFAELHAFF